MSMYFLSILSESFNLPCSTSSIILASSSITSSLFIFKVFNLLKKYTIIPITMMRNIQPKTTNLANVSISKNILVIDKITKIALIIVKIISVRVSMNVSASL